MVNNYTVHAAEVTNRPVILGDTTHFVDYSESEISSHRSKENIYQSSESINFNNYGKISRPDSTEMPLPIAEADGAISSMERPKGKKFNWRSVDVESMRKTWKSESSIYSESCGEYFLSFGTRARKDTEGKSEFNVRLHGLDAKSKMIKLKADLAESTKFTFQLPPDNVRSLRFISCSSSSSDELDYFEVTRGSSKTFLIPMKSRVTQEGSALFIPGCKYKIKATVPFQGAFNILLHGEAGRQLLTEKDLEGSRGEGDKVIAIFSGANVGAVKNVQALSKDITSGLISNFEVHKCSQTEQHSTKSTYRWDEAYRCATPIDVNRELLFRLEPMAKANPLSERVLNTIVEHPRTPVDHPRRLVQRAASELSTNSEDFGNREEYEVVLGYNIDGIWNGPFTLIFIGQMNHCKVHFGDHKSVSPHNVSMNKTVMYHTFAHDYLGPLKYIVINQENRKIMQWPFEYIWVKHSSNVGQVRHPIATDIYRQKSTWSLIRFVENAKKMIFHEIDFPRSRFFAEKHLCHQIPSWLR